MSTHILNTKTRDGTTVFDPTTMIGLGLDEIESIKKNSIIRLSDNVTSSEYTPNIFFSQIYYIDGAKMRIKDKAFSLPNLRLEIIRTVYLVPG